MLFNSAEFLFAFLPLCVLGFYVLGRRNSRLALAWLVVSSLFYYGWWNPVYLWIILASMAINYAVGIFLGRRDLTNPERRALLVAGVSANLAALGYYKYANFFVQNVNTIAGTSIHLDRIVLPLAISFFTFQQIAYLVDSYRGLCREYDFASYCLFVTFFPQLIAGPIVHHAEMLPQFGRRTIYRPRPSRFAVGLTILAIGLFKKVVIADGIASLATPVFSAADSGVHISATEAWVGSLAYTFQLYFDFSGYSDMAIGAARLFGIRLPVNFYSPYKSKNIIDFWRRWHMTLSRFLRDYVYIALGGNRKGKVRRYENLMATMLLGGLWHGAGWNFVIWGGLHGVYLVVNHGFRALRGRLLPEWRPFGAISGFAAWAFTFLSVVVGWVFFRAGTFQGALVILNAMVGGGATASSVLPDLGPESVALLISLLAVVALLPNTLEFTRRARPALGMPRQPSGPSLDLRWRPNLRWAVAMGAFFAFALLHLGRVSEFLYFQF